MAKPKVVALVGHALFSAGVINRLEEYRGRFDLVRYDSDTDDVLQQIEGQEPSVVIIDTDFEAHIDLCSLEELIHRFPSTKIIRLNPEREGFEVVTSEQHNANAVEELLDVITGSGSGS